MSISAGTGSGCGLDNQATQIPGQNSDTSAAHLMWPLSSELEMAPLPTAVGCGRLHARSVLHEWRLGHVAQDATILVSELLTNSVKASCGQGTPVRLRLLTDRRQLIIEAWDRNPRPPQQRRADYAEESGRGLNVIAAIAIRWGYYRSGNWKAVWAEMLTGASNPER